MPLICLRVRLLKSNGIYPFGKVFHKKSCNCCLVITFLHVCKTMNLNENLQDYLSQSGSSKYQPNNNGLLGFWNGKQASTEISLADDDADTSNMIQQDGNNSRSNNRSGWLKSFNLPFTQSAESNRPPSRIQKLCSVFPTLVQ